MEERRSIPINPTFLLSRYCFSFPPLTCLFISLFIVQLWSHYSIVSTLPFSSISFHSSMSLDFLFFFCTWHKSTLYMRSQHLENSAQIFWWNRVTQKHLCSISTFIFKMLTVLWGKTCSGHGVLYFLMLLDSHSRKACKCEAMDSTTVQRLN